MFGVWTNASGIIEITTDMLYKIYKRKYKHIIQMHGICKETLIFS